MTSLSQLWSKRFNNYLKELGKYAGLIVNDHLSAILFFLFAFFAIYYHNLLNTLSQLPSHVYKLPLLVVVSLIIALCLLLGRPMWLTKEADKSYLYPRGREWSTYWLKGTFVSLVGPGILLSVVGLVLYPFVKMVSGWDSSEMVLFIVCLVLAKVLSHLLLYLNIYGLGLGLGRTSHSLVFSLVFLVSFILPRPWHLVWLGLVFVGVSGYVLWGLYKSKKAPLNFEHVVFEEEKRVSAFYKIISYFADVPQMSSGFREDKLSNALIARLHSLNHNRYSYLYVRLLVRSNDYRAIWLRVAVFISAFLLMSDNIYLACGLVVVGHLMTVMQLVNVITSYDYNPFQMIYSNRTGSRLVEFEKTAGLFILVQSLIYLLVYGLSHGFGVELLILSLVTVLAGYLVLKLYVKNWSKKKAIE